MRQSNSDSGLTATRSNRRLVAVLTALAVCALAHAWSYDSQEATTTNVAQVRLGASFDKKWKNGLRLGVSEDLWFDAYNSMVGSHFRKSYTTLDFGYKPIDYVKLDLGYTLKILGPNSTWSDAKKVDANEWIRHRVFFSVTGSYSFDYAKIYLRERVQLDMRTDSVNLLEQNKFDWCLRSKVGTEFIVPGKPVKPYLWVELINTLNVPEYQRRNGHQFISSVRTQAGVKWRLTRLSSLDFFYRFTYGYDRDINITKKKGYIELTEETLYMHTLGVRYNLDW